MEIAELVRLAKTGDKAAFGDLVSRYQKVAVTKALSVLGDFHLSQDTAQDAFVVAFRRLESLRSPESFGPWLLEIVKRQALAKRRRRKNLIALSDGFEEPSSKAEPGWLERYQFLIQAIGELPSHEQEAVVLYYLEGLSSKEVGEALDRPIGTVTKQLSRGIKRLQERLTEATHDTK
jgi:RNA polymerase sigma-70 factor (ECF subfamily)